MRSTLIGGVSEHEEEAVGPPGVLAAEASFGGGGAAEPEPDLARTEPSLICDQHILAFWFKRILPFETSVDISESSSSSLSPLS